MKNRGLEFFVAALLMGVGVLFGSLTPSRVFFEFKLTDVFGMISSLATIVGVAIAFDALGSWKRQIHYSKKYAHAEELEAVDSCFKSLQRIGVACRGIGIAHLRRDGMQEAEIELDKKRIDYFVQHGAYQSIWWRASRYLDKVELAEYRWTPDAVDKLYFESVTKFHLEMTKLAGVDQMEAHMSIEKNHSQFRALISEAANEARLGVDDLFQKLLK